MKSSVGGRKFKPYQSSQSSVFSKDRLQTTDKSARISQDQLNEDVFVAGQFSNPSSLIQNFPQRIHSQLASFLMWQEKNPKRNQQQQPQLIAVNQKKPLFQVPFNTKLEQEHNDVQRLHSQEQPIGTSAQLGPHKPFYMPRIDPKVKRALSQQSKNNFLQFLLVQKVGHQQSEQRMLDYLQREHNYQLPLVSPKPKHNTLSNRPQGRNQGQKKGGGQYLLNQEETDQQLQSQVMKILACSPEIRYNSNRYEIDDDPPLDEYIRLIHEKKLQGLRKMQIKCKLANMKLDGQKAIDNLRDFDI